MVDRVIACIAESLALSEDQVTAKSRLIPDLGADSLDFMDIIFGLEREFGIQLNKEDFNFLEKAGIETPGAPNSLINEERKTRLRVWLPEIPLNEDVLLTELKNFITPETIAQFVKEHLCSANIP